MDTAEFEKMHYNTCEESDAAARACQPTAVAILHAVGDLSRVLFDIVLELRELNKREAN